MNPNSSILTSGTDETYKIKEKKAAQDRYHRLTNFFDEMFRNQDKRNPIHMKTSS